MKGILLRWVILSASILVTAYIIPGIEVKGLLGAIIAAAILGIVNAVLKPVVMFFSIPFLVLTLGLFALVINALMLYVAAAISGAFHINGFLSAILGSISISIFSTIFGMIIK